MKLTYQVGIAALIHLAVITVFNVANGVFSTVQQCTQNSSDCVGDLILSLLYFMVITVWFALLWVLAATAQARRSRKLTFLLLGGEFLVFVVALFDLHHHSSAGLLGTVTSLIDVLLAGWVGVLAIRLFISGGARVTGSSRARRRRLAREPIRKHPTDL